MKFLRGSENIENDLKVGHSFHQTDCKTIKEAIGLYGDLGFKMFGDDVVLPLQGLCGIAIENEDEIELYLHQAKRYSENVFLCEGEEAEEDFDLPDGESFINVKLLRKIK